MAVYYTPSGKVPVAGMLVAAATAALAAVVCAFAYCYSIWYIPIIYLNIVVVMGVPFLLSWLIARLGIKTGKIRNRSTAALLGLAGGVLFFVVQWALHCVMVTSSGEVHSIDFGSNQMGFAETGFSIEALLFYLFNPSETFSLIGAINEVGTWGIKSTTVSGIPLTICWVIEAFCILCISVYLPWKQAVIPFSETENQWLAERVLNGNVEITNASDQLKHEIESGNFNTLLQAAAGTGNPFRRLVLYTDSQLHEIYLTVKEVTVKVDSKGKETEDEKDEVKEVMIPRQLYDVLVSRFG
jgi:hypothetical protein